METSPITNKTGETQSLVEDKEITSIKIQNALVKRLERGEQIPPGDFVDSGIMMLAHLGSLTDKMHKLAQQCAQMKAKSIEEGSSVAKAEALMEASPEFVVYRQLKSRSEQIEQIAMLTASRSKAASTEFVLNK